MTLSVVLLSGGFDSAVMLAMALREGEAVALTFDYAQRHSREIDSASKVAAHFGVRHFMMPLHLKTFHSALVGRGGEIPEGRLCREEIPDTYVPARNIIFLSMSLGVAESIGADRIYIGANAVDYSGYPDCRPELIKAFQKVADVGTKCGVEGKQVKVHAPIIGMSKADIVRKGLELGVPFHLTWSCYRGGEKACGRCDSCLLRLKGFSEAGVEDPIAYEVL